MNISGAWDNKRIVLDTNVMVSALLKGGASPGKIVDMFIEGELELFYNDDILAEYEDVLYRPHLKIPSCETGILMAAIRQHGEEVWPLPSVHAMIDEDDRIFYDTAKSAEAYLITGNTKHYPDEPFILTPSASLAL